MTRRNPPRERSVPQQLALFRVGQFLCALGIDQVQEINRSLALTKVHEAPSYVRGILNLRGQIVTVIDLRRRLGLSPTVIGHSTRNLVVKRDGEMVGLLVDAVEDIVEVAAEEIQPTPPHLSGELGESFRGVYQQAGELVAVLSLERVLSESHTD